MPVNQWRLVATAPTASATAAIAIGTPEVIVGRGPEPQVQLSANGVSKRHARLTLDEAGLWVEDLDSRNGVFVNGDRISQATQLRLGDLVHFATEGFLVERTGAAPDANVTVEEPNLEATLAAEVERRERVERLLNAAECQLKHSHEATEQAQLAAARLSSFGAILDKSDNEIYIFDCETWRFVHANQGAVKNLGYSVDELRELTPLDLKPEFEPNSFRDLLEPMSDGARNAIRFSTSHLRKDGTLYPVDVHLHRSVFESRDVLVAVVLDMTEHERARDEIRKLSAAVEQSPASVVITDVEKRVAYVNTMFCRVTGYEKSEAGQIELSDLLGGERSSDHGEMIWEAVDAGEVWCGELSAWKKNGESFWASASVAPIRNARDEVTHYLVELQDISEKKELIDRMEGLAFSDSLTQLPNRHAILQAIQRTVDRGGDHRYALLFLDFDRFKLINDSLGHEMGDELLRQIADRLRANLRSTDDIVPARLGGDEFVVFIRSLASGDDALVVAERLLAAFAESYQLGGNTVHSTASIGVVAGSSDYTSANEVLRDADLAMYQAKSRGRGRCVVFDRTMHEQAQERLRLECDLRHALAQDELFLVYQPIVSLDTGELVGVESLARWSHPELGLVRPDQFIPIAEETGLIIDLGERVLEEACRQFGLWRSALGDAAPTCVHVNVSRLQMLRPDFKRVVERVLRDYRLPQHALHLEITESTIMNDPEVVVTTMNGFRDLGVCIDVDDFGTGYSSLSCLHEFPIDVLKIDRSFINNERHIRDYVALLQSIVALAQNLGLQVVAEGVETAEQVATLQVLGCEYGQGYYFAKPLAAEAIEQYIRDRVQPGSDPASAKSPAASL